MAWYVYGLVGDVLARLAQLATGSAGATGEIHPAAVFGYAVAAFAGGAIAANAVRPKADLKWGVVFALLVLASEFVGVADWLQSPEGRAWTMFAAAGALLVFAAVCGFLFVRSRTTSTPPPEPDLE